LPYAGEKGQKKEGKRKEKGFLFSLLQIVAKG
jgi:hypothetical protein